LGKSQKAATAVIIVIAVMILAILWIFTTMRNTREFMNLFTFVFSNLALILFSGTTVILALVAFFWYLTASRERMGKETHTLEKLCELGKGLFSGSETERLCKNAADALTSATGHSLISIFFWNREKEHFVMAWHNELPEELRNHFFLTIRNDSLRCSTSPEPEFPVFELDNIPSSYIIEDPASDGDSLVFFPMKSSHEMIGAIVLHELKNQSLLTHEARDTGTAIAQILGNYHLTRVLNQELSSASISDISSGALKMCHFPRFLEQEIERADRHEGATSLLAIDVGGGNRDFTMDSDVLLQRRVVERLKSVVRSFDLIFRDEPGECFVVILSQTDNETALDVSGRILTALTREEATEAASKIKLEAFMGISTYPTDATLEESLVDNVHAALEDARKASESTIVNFMDLY
jgi:diguanylate cyclase (GGDEF)-like protein